MYHPDMLEAARTGDQEAFRHLVEPHLPEAYRIALLIILDRELARDAVQEALIRVFRNLGKYRPEQPFKPWFRHVVVNESRRLARRQWSQPSLLERLPELKAPDDDSPEASLLAHEDREQLWQALAALSGLHRTVLVLRYYQGLSEAEMAEALDLPAGTIKSRLHNARKLLEQELARTTRPSGWTTRLVTTLQRRFSS